MSSLPAGYRAVVVGANGGIGSAVADQLGADLLCGEVIGLSRTGNPRLDISDETTIEAAAETIKADGPVHLVLIATGILHGPAFQPEKSLRQLSKDPLADVFAVNAIGPLLVVKWFSELLPRQGRSVIAALSARVGSISDNRLGGWYAYRMSKAALNMGLKTAAIEIARKRPDALCLALHPGTVRTRLSEPFTSGRASTDPDQSAADLLGCIDQARSEGPGGFLAYDGSTIDY